jgi:hypothetical protein
MSPHGAKPLDVVVDGRTFRRIPIHTDVLRAGRDPAEAVLTFAGPHAQTGDTVVLSESAVAIMQGRVASRGDVPTRGSMQRPDADCMPGRGEPVRLCTLRTYPAPSICPRVAYGTGNHNRGRKRGRAALRIQRG